MMICGKCGKDMPGMVCHCQDQSSRSAESPLPEPSNQMAVKTTLAQTAPDTKPTANGTSWTPEEQEAAKQFMMCCAG